MALSEEQAREALEMEPFPLVQAIKEASQSCEPEIQELGGNAIHQARLAVDLLESVTKNRNKSRIPSKVDQPYLKLNLITTAAEGGLREFNVYSADDLLEQLTELGHLLKVSAGTYSPSVRSTDFSYYIILASPTPTSKTATFPHQLKHSLAEFTSNGFSHLPTSIRFLFLLMIKSLTGMSVRDMFSLLDIAVPQPSEKGHERLNSEPMIDDWHSVPTVVPDQPNSRTTLVKTFYFPGEYPEFFTKFIWMERRKLHGKVPQSVSKAAVWGKKKENDGSFSSVIAFSDGLVAESLSMKLHNLISTTTGSEIPNPAAHWIHSLEYLYRMFLNDAHLRLEEVARKIETLKYSNLSKPSVGGSLVCLMYMNHLQYHRQLILSLQAEMDDFPQAWGFNTRLPWESRIRALCRPLLKNISEVYRKASSTRSLIIEQKSLLESSNLGYLTILATIFVPMTAVAGIFGMNTSEINDGHWPTKYFTIVAVPLTVISVLLPLVMLRLLDVLDRLSSQRRLLKLTQDVVILFILICSVLDIVQDYSSLLDYSLALDAATTAAIPSIALVLLPYLLLNYTHLVQFWQILMRRKRNTVHFRSEVKKSVRVLSGPFMFFVLWWAGTFERACRLVACVGYFCVRAWS
ncbi:hypothetical protein BJ166DRAFT_240166 [Pestalotiopsis sp. NC0098]|nr:hypothetical protein BJ166DRAFT_240166 [Pestalotiopsis sp. NC0098]